MGEASKVKSDRPLNVLVYNPAYIDQYRKLLPQIEELNRDDVNLLICNSEIEIRAHIGQVDILFISTSFPA